MASLHDSRAWPSDIQDLAERAKGLGFNSFWYMAEFGLYADSHNVCIGRVLITAECLDNIEASLISMVEPKSMTKFLIIDDPVIEGQLSDSAKKAVQAWYDSHPYFR